MRVKHPTSNIQHPEKLQDLSFRPGLDHSERKLELGSWIFIGCWMLVVGCLLLPLLCFAQRPSDPRPAPLDPVKAEREAHALVADMLSQKPAQTNTGMLKIRNAKGEQ